MNQMKAEAIFSWKYPAKTIPPLKTSLLKMRSWNRYIYPTTFSLICFTETTSANFTDIDSYENIWKSFDKFTSHGLAISYQTFKISFVKEFPIT